MKRTASRHIGIIPDGGRRWAKRSGVSLAHAYQRTFRRLGVLLKLLHGAGCGEVSVYVLSQKNLGRSRADLIALYEALPTLVEVLHQLAATGTVSASTVVGAQERLPVAVRRLLERLQFRGTHRRGMKLCLLVGYDAWDELRRQARGGRAGARLRVRPSTPVDAVIRSAGGVLLSGFLPLQSQYAHLVVTRRLFNDLTLHEFRRLADRALLVVHRMGR